MFRRFLSLLEVCFYVLYSCCLCCEYYENNERSLRYHCCFCVGRNNFEIFLFIFCNRLLLEPDFFLLWCLQARKDLDFSFAGLKNSFRLAVSKAVDDDEEQQRRNSIIESGWRKVGWLASRDFGESKGASHPLPPGTLERHSHIPGICLCNPSGEHYPRRDLRR